ncbi:hypothetical protein WR25_13989 [Diploscapter pachys]|uniref:uridine/cytidine kinase n=1 Tax=Diploscapter pachys TaxID=2018661 RepID=A0A2A2KVB8_9BILA|nr:hypothetical protein WR25_13989 [Diploscapter pachys]
MQKRVRLPFFIGVAGGTASGKSLVTKKIIDRLETTAGKRKQVISIHLDSFYKELNEESLRKAEAGEYDFDHPEAFDFDYLIKTLEKLDAGHSVQIPKYDPGLYARSGLITIQPADVIIVEGILVFYDDRIRDKFGMKLFVDTDADIRLARRVRRDVGQHNRPLSLVLQQYTRNVKPAFEEFCQPTKKWADVIIPRGGENDVAIDLLVQHIQDLLRTPRGSPDLEQDLARGASLEDTIESAKVAQAGRPH